MRYTEDDFLETAGPKELAEIARARELTRAYAASDYRDAAGRRAILEELFGAIGENVAVDTPFHCDHGKNIFLGNDIVIGMDCIFIDNAPIRVGDRAMIASGVQLCTASHPIRPAERLLDARPTFFRTYAQPIVVGPGAWIGARAVVLPGVTIGENAVVGAGSVVTKDVPPNTVVVGNPARVIRTFEP